MKRIFEILKYYRFVIWSLICIIGLGLTLAYGASEKSKDRRVLTSFVFLTGQTTCTTATTKYAIAIEAETLSIKAPSTNTGKIYVGDATTATSTAGYELSPGESLDLGGSGVYIATSTIYVTSSVNGDKICWARLN